MPVSIPNPLWVYRIIHYKNLEYILQNGIYVRDHHKFDPNYINIGNTDIIDVRGSSSVKINNYGNIGAYIPFYFGRQSIMLYNILTDYKAEKQLPEDIIYLCCKVDKLVAACKRFFFTDGQANKKFTEHFCDLSDLENLDWDVIKGSDFKKSEEDPDKQRRYQAEFLVHQYVPIDCIGTIVVYNQDRKDYIENLVNNNNLNIPVHLIRTDYYFHFK